MNEKMTWKNGNVFERNKLVGCRLVQFRDVEKWQAFFYKDVKFDSRKSVNFFTSLAIIRFS
jgi:hypothetical protein